MAVIVNAFNGKLNYDVSPYRIENGDYLDALNITTDAQGEAQDKVVSNILGNTLKSYTLPSGTNKVIGGKDDKIRNRYYLFIWNSNGFNLILYYNRNTDTVVKLLESKTDSGGVDILNFNPSYKIYSVNIFYRDEGDIIFFNDAYNKPRNISTSDNYTPWLAEYLEVAKSPFKMPPKVVYENDTTVTINNLRNALFQFSVRPVYDNNQKSVWSARSIVPLPYQPSLQLTEDTFTNNSRISVTFSTGGADVKKVELAVRQFTSPNQISNWELVRSFDKAELGLADDDVYNFKFYNDGKYSTLDQIDTVQLQDYVPQRANAQELVNGNTPVYGGILEGYDPIETELSVTVGSAADGFFFDYNGLLFFAICEGLDSGSSGTTMKVYVYGTGTNTAGVVTTLNNAKATFVINAVDSTTLTQIGASVANATDAVTAATLLGNVSTTLQVNGWTQTSLVGNVLTMDYAAGFTLYSSGTKLTAASVQENTTSFATPFQASSEVGLMYFDGNGGTNGTLTNTAAIFNTPAPSSSYNYPQPLISIAHRPPLWARYYAPVRINNSTYQKRLEWISQSAYASDVVGTPAQRFAYLGISNIDAYNLQISATDNVVSYQFEKGDRVRMFSRYTVVGTLVQLTSIVDYEIVGTEVNPKINGQVKTGTFIKIYYPTSDIDSNLKFDGDADFSHYRILLYSIRKRSESTGNTFFEFGKMFGIGNAGTVNAYHIGLDQTQSPNLATPAKIGITNGDLFWRQRTVPFGETYNVVAGGTSQDIDSTLNVVATPSLIENSKYRLQTSVGAAVVSLTDPALYPTNASTNFLFSNKQALGATPTDIIVKFKGTMTLYNSNNENSTVGFGAIICTNAVPLNPKYYTDLITPNIVNVPAGTVGTIEIDTSISVPPTGFLWLVVKSSTPSIGNNLVVNTFDLEVKIEQSATIEIIEQSFNDTYNIVTNSNGRPTVIEVNARQTYFPAMVRFGQSYQENTNINGTNRFYAENFDDYDRSFGDIMRLHVRDRYMKVYQKLKVGNVPILTQIVKDITGNPLQANTDQLINKIQYYSGDYGIGDSPCSLAWDNFSDYFVDDFRGVVCRLSQDGITPLSIIYSTNAFFNKYLPAYRRSLNNGYPATGQPYAGDATIYGAFDAFTNKYIVALEEINRYDISGNLIFHQDPFTLSFDEVNNKFESQLSYKPEWVGSLNTLLISCKNGLLYTHDSTTYCNFYGTQYPCSITLVFNDANSFKKTFLAIMETGTITWVAPEITTSMNSYGNTKQQSELKIGDFKTLETTYNASFLRDRNSIGGLINGGVLKGIFITIKLQVNEANAADLVALNSVSVKFIESHLNSH